MTNKVQISFKFTDGAIFVVGGDNPEEFADNMCNLDLANVLDKYLAILAGGAAVLQEPHVEKSIKVESIELASGGKHMRWNVRGGNFTKHGITCWPEVLEAAGLDKLKTDDINEPKGDWTAYYITKMYNGKEIPDKVTRLVKDA